MDHKKGVGGKKDNAVALELHCRRDVLWMASGALLLALALILIYLPAMHCQLFFDEERLILEQV